MVRLLQWILVGYIHRWKILREVKFSQFEDRPKDVTTTGTRFYLQCECCGDVLKRDFTRDTSERRAFGSALAYGVQN